MENKTDPQQSLFIVDEKTFTNVCELIKECDSINPKFSFSEETDIENSIVTNLSIDNVKYKVIKLHNSNLDLITKCLSKYVPGMQPQHCEWDPRTQTVSINMGVYKGYISFAKFLNLITNRTLKNKEI